MAQQLLSNKQKGLQVRNAINDNFTELYSLVNDAYVSYGIRYTISTDTITRLGKAADMVANANGGENDFDSVMPWGGMRRCNLADDLTVNAYLGDFGYVETGANGQVMVEVPAFYYKRTLVDSDTIETWITTVPNLAGYKLHPWFYDENGVAVAKKYISAYEGSLYDVTAPATEVNTLTVTAACTTSGDLTITLDQYNAFTVAVLDTDNTVELVATKIRDATYTGWTTGGAGAVVTFTYNTTGPKTTATFSGGSTGVTATVAKTTTGAGGYVLMDTQVASFTQTTGDKLCSIAGVKPISGKDQDLTLPKSRILANNRGAKWQQQYFAAVSAIQMLFVVEYASLNSQLKLGLGPTSIPDSPNTLNHSVVTGATSALGNISGKATGTDGLVSTSYRGVENFYGNIWKWVDGININNYVAYISTVNGAFQSDKFDGNYVARTQLPSANGYMSKTVLSPSFDYGFLPTEAVGSNSTKYCDYYYQNGVGTCVTRLGGYWADGATAGAFYWYVTYSSSHRARTIGARLCV